MSSDDRAPMNAGSARRRSEDARAELRALLTDDAHGRPPARAEVVDALALMADARPAAVLVLFGVLDAVSSTRGARDAAVSRELDVLLLARATTLRAHAGQVAFPGGRREPDETAVDAALREAEEETGLDPRGVEVLGSLREVPLEYSSHVVTPVVGWWRHPSPVRAVDAAESSAVFRAPVADLLDPANRGVTVIRRAGDVWSGPGFHVRTATGDHLVWGFTAMLLDGLFDRLGWTEPWDRHRELPIRW